MRFLNFFLIFIFPWNQLNKYKKIAKVFFVRFVYFILKNLQKKIQYSNKQLKLIKNIYLAYFGNYFGKNITSNEDLEYLYLYVNILPNVM